VSPESNLRCASQVATTVGHSTPTGAFAIDPHCPWARDHHRPVAGEYRAICPSEEFPNTEIQERVPVTENIVPCDFSIFGDGLWRQWRIKPDRLARKQCGPGDCGQVLYVPIVEAPGETGVGRFGWKNQHASLLSFSADAYLNEMGITNKLFPEEVTKLCNTAPEPNDAPGPDGLEDMTVSPVSCGPKARPRRRAWRPKAMRGQTL
jgi:hypothetical protein